LCQQKNGGGGGGGNPKTSVEGVLFPHFNPTPCSKTKSGSICKNKKKTKNSPKKSLSNKNSKLGIDDRKGRGGRVSKKPHIPNKNPKSKSKKSSPKKKKKKKSKSKSKSKSKFEEVEDIEKKKKKKKKKRKNNKKKNKNKHHSLPKLNLKRIGGRWLTPPGGDKKGHRLSKKQTRF
jgi:hypothetical protein